MVTSVVVINTIYRKFICINDNIDHNKEGAEIVRDRQLQLRLILSLFTGQNGVERFL